MANKLYVKGGEKTLGKLVDWENDDLRVIAVSSGYTFDQDNDEFLADVSTYALSSGLALTAQSITGAVFDADDVNITLTAGTVKALIIYLHDADPAAASLLAYLDNILGFPFVTAGGVQPIVWPAAGIFDLLGG